MMHLEEEGGHGLPWTFDVIDYYRLIVGWVKNVHYLINFKKKGLGGLEEYLWTN